MPDAYPDDQPLAVGDLVCLPGQYRTGPLGALGNLPARIASIQDDWAMVTIGDGRYGEVGLPVTNLERLDDCPSAPTGNAIACPKTWQTDTSAHVVVHPQPPAIRMHRCAYVGAHTAHMCPCGSYLVGGPA